VTLEVVGLNFGPSVKEPRLRVPQYLSHTVQGTEYEEMLLGLAGKFFFCIRKPIPEDFANLAAPLSGELNQIGVEVMVEQAVPGVRGSQT